MKLCVFYNKPNGWRNVTWFVCKACQKRLDNGDRVPMLQEAAQEIITNARRGKS